VSLQSMIELILDMCAMVLKVSLRSH